MKTIETAIDTVNKFGDTSTIFKLDLKDDNEYVPLDDKKVVLNVANDTGLVLTTPVTTFSGHTVMVDFSSQGLAELTPDSYNLEIEVTYSDGDISKFPTKGGLKFNITNNLKETTGALVPTVTFDNVLEAVDEKIAVYMNTVKVGPAGPAGPAGNVDTSRNNTFTGENKFTQPINGVLQLNSPTVTDLNKLTTSGSYLITNSILNTPVSMPNGAVVNVSTFDTNVTYQVITAREDTNTLSGKVKTWVRGKYGSIWADWRIYSLDDTVVHNTGTETVAGDKTFTGNTKLTGQTTLQTGKYGLRVTIAGVQKTSDNGLTWTNI